MRKRQSPATIVRAPKDRKNPYKMVRQATFEDARLTWEDRGVLGYLLVKPDDWEIDVADLWRAGDAGRNKIYRILAHLEECGYLKRETIRLQGRFIGTRYVLHEEPIPKDEPMEQLPFPENEDTVDAPPCTENGDTVQQLPFPQNGDAVEQSPFPQKPYPVKPYPVNGDQTNNVYTTNYETENQERKETKEDSFLPSTPLPADFERAVELLTDPEVGLADATARELAQAHGFDTIARQVFAWRDGIADGSKFNDARALINRFAKNFDAAPPSPRQMASDLYRRHCADGGDAGGSRYNEFPEDEPRRSYCPPGYEDIVLGYSHHSEAHPEETHP